MQTRIAWTHSHYGRGMPPTGDEAVRGVLDAWRVIGGPARLIVDEDAGWAPADAEPDGGGWIAGRDAEHGDETGGWDAGQPPASTEAEAVRAWWAGYAAPGDEDEDDSAPGWRAAAEAVAGASLPPLGG